MIGDSVAGEADYFSRVVDTFGSREFDGRVLAMVVNKPMLAGSVLVKPSDLSFVIDAQGVCSVCPREIAAKRSA